MKPIDSVPFLAVLLTLCFFAGVAAHAAGAPDMQWTYKTINGKALKMDVFLPEGLSSQALRFDWKEPSDPPRGSGAPTAGRV